MSSELLRTLLMLLSLNDLMTARTFWDAVCGAPLPATLFELFVLAGFA